MSYQNIVFVKLEKRLLNDYRWFTMSEPAQLIYVKLILLAAETYNKIPKPDNVLRVALRCSLELSDFQSCIKEIETNFPKFLSNKHFRYFKDFEYKTNYIPNRGSLRSPQGVAKLVVDKEEDKEEEEEKEKYKAQKKNKVKDRTSISNITNNNIIKPPSNDGALTYFCSKYKTACGKEYIPTFAKDNSIFKSLLRVMTIEELKALIDEFFAITDKFCEEHGYTVGMFKARINSLRGKKKPESPLALKNPL
jgi:hypothetical protein